jgi:hypothetical protein
MCALTSAFGRTADATHRHDAISYSATAPSRDFVAPHQTLQYKGFWPVAGASELSKDRRGKLDKNDNPGPAPLYCAQPIRQVRVRDTSCRATCPSLNTADA